MAKNGKKLRTGSQSGSMISKDTKTIVLATIVLLIMMTIGTLEKDPSGAQVAIIRPYSSALPTPAVVYTDTLLLIHDNASADAVIVANNIKQAITPYVVRVNVKKFSEVNLEEAIDSQLIIFVNSRLQNEKFVLFSLNPAAPAKYVQGAVAGVNSLPSSYGHKTLIHNELDFKELDDIYFFN